VLGGGVPVAGGGALGAGDLLVVPVDGKRVQRVAGRLALPRSGEQRPAQRDAALAGGDQLIGAGAAGVDGVLAG